MGEKIEIEGYKKGVFLVIVLGIIFDTEKRKILIGKRENDPNIPKLTWGFPGGIPEYGEDLDEVIVKKVKEKTGLKVENLGSIYAKIYEEKNEFLSIYYLCEVIGGKEKLGGDFKELKWVCPEELENYFTTSFHPKLKEYILNLK